MFPKNTIKPAYQEKYPACFRLKLSLFLFLQGSAGWSDPAGCGRHLCPLWCATSCRFPLRPPEDRAALPETAWDGYYIWFLRAFSGQYGWNKMFWEYFKLCIKEQSLTLFIGIHFFCLTLTVFNKCSAVILNICSTSLTVALQNIKTKIRNAWSIWSLK